MTDLWWPKRGTARRPTTGKQKGMWFRCLRSLGIRPRKAYSTWHTLIAWLLSSGTNLKGLAKYCGTSVQMIEQSCGRYVRSDLLATLIVAEAHTITPAQRASREQLS